MSAGVLQSVVVLGGLLVVVVVVVMVSSPVARAACGRRGDFPRFLLLVILRASAPWALSGFPSEHLRCSAVLRVGLPLSGCRSGLSAPSPCTPLAKGLPAPGRTPHD